MLTIIIANNYEVLLLHIALLVELKGVYKFFILSNKIKYSTFTCNVKFIFADILASVHVCFLHEYVLQYNDAITVLYKNKSIANKHGIYFEKAKMS